MTSPEYSLYPDPEIFREVMAQYQRVLLAIFGNDPELYNRELKAAVVELVGGSREETALRLITLLNIASQLTSDTAKGFAEKITGSEEAAEGVDWMAYLYGWEQAILAEFEKESESE